MGFKGELIALAFLFADVQQPHARLLHPEHVAGIDVSKQGELVQVAGFAVGVGAHIEHQHLLTHVFGGEQGSNRGPFNALEPPEPKDRGSHHSSRVAG